jgi:hypothetical protein
METLNFKITGNHEVHTGEATILNDYNEGTIHALNNMPGSMDALKTRKIGSFDGYDVYENYYDSGSSDYIYFAIEKH